jgi:ParB-like chromosome segregation protein Spo0J
MEYLLMTAKTPFVHDMKIVMVPLAKLRPWHGNPRKTIEGVDQVLRSIEAFGFTNPVLVRRANNEVIAGHTRIEALKKAGATKAPVIYLDLNEVDAHTYSLADNKLTENTPWDGLKLADVFTALDQLDVKLDLTGFSREEIEDYVNGPLGMAQPEPLPDPQIVGAIDGMSDYVVIQFDTPEQGQEFRKRMGMSESGRVLPYAQLEEKW